MSHRLHPWLFERFLDICPVCSRLKITRTRGTSKRKRTRESDDHASDRHDVVSDCQRRDDWATKATEGQRKSRQEDARPSSATSTRGCCQEEAPSGCTGLQKETSPDRPSLARLNPFAQRGPRGPPLSRAGLRWKIVGPSPTTSQGRPVPRVQIRAQESPDTGRRQHYRSLGLLNHQCLAQSIAKKGWRPPAGGRRRHLPHVSLRKLNWLLFQKT